MIRRVLERRSAPASQVQEDTTGTISVMLRVLPPPRALLAVGDSVLRAQLEHRVASELLDCEVAASDAQALELYTLEFRPVVITDSLELIRTVRARQSGRAPWIIYVAQFDEAADRASGLAAGADECVGRRASDAELHARLGAGRRIAELEAVLRITLKENRELSTTDDLTRVASRRFFNKHFPREVERAARYGRALALILCDIDHFKAINDRFGHAGGDQILAQFGGRLQESLRHGIDWVARIGGEEFAIVLPETDYERSLNVARKLRLAVAGRPLQVGDQDVVVTASFGLCGLDRVPAASRQLPQHLLKVTDAALYRSKHAGRNRVTATLLQDRPA